MRTRIRLVATSISLCLAAFTLSGMRFGEPIPGCYEQDESFCTTQCDSLNWLCADPYPHCQFDPASDVEPCPDPAQLLDPHQNCVDDAPNKKWVQCIYQDR